MILLFSRPMWALMKGPVKAILFFAAVAYASQMALAPSSRGSPDHRSHPWGWPRELDGDLPFEAQHVRLTVLETRGGAGGRRGGERLAGVGAWALEAVDLTQNNCSLSDAETYIQAQGGEATGTKSITRRNGTRLMLSFPAPVKANGFRITTSRLNNSETNDPVRFVVHINKVRASETTSQSMADCLEDNGWLPSAQVAALTNSQHRALVIARLRQRGPAWCSDAGGVNEDAVGEGEGAQICITGSGNAATDEELIDMCTSPWQLAEDKWEVFSASVCRWSVSSLRCLPQPQHTARIPVNRGATINFDFRLRWYMGPGLFYWRVWVVVALFLASMPAKCWLCVHRDSAPRLSYLAFSSVWLIHGIMVGITAWGLVLDPDPTVEAMDSVYFFFEAAMSVWIGTIMLWDQKLFMRYAIVPFLVQVPVLNLHRALILEINTFALPISNTIVAVWWLLLMVLREASFPTSSLHVM